MRKEKDFEKKKKIFIDGLNEGIWARIPSNFVFEESVGFFKRIDGHVIYVDFGSGGPSKIVSKKEPELEENEFFGLSACFFAEEVCDSDLELSIPARISFELNTKLFMSSDSID